MKGVGFSLAPFIWADVPPGIGIRGEVGRRSDVLSVDYDMTGPLAEILIPPPAERPERMGGLWEGTCLELFIAEKGAAGYWEFNLSPSGHWNAYGFSSYRKGMHEEAAFSSLPFQVRRGPNALRLSLEISLDRIIPAGRAIDLAISAVIKTTGGRTTFWALRHPGTEPDFHLRDGFAVRL